MEEYGWAIAEYYKYNEHLSSNLKGYSYANHILLDWLRLRFKHGSYVVMYDINSTQKPNEFWLSLPLKKAVELTKDVVVLKCKNKEEVQDLLTAIDPSFASAIGWVNGNMVDWNWE